jgi:hypothetical protein
MQQLFTDRAYLHILQIGFHGQHKINATNKISAGNTFISGEHFKKWF